MAGESAKIVKKVFDDKEVYDSTCIVKFRPRKDWKGEYGFDWVREGVNDYEEKISFGTPSGSIPIAVAVEMLKKYLGDEEYEKWREERRKTKVGPAYIDANGKVVINDIFKREIIEASVDKDAVQEIKNNLRIYDNKAWQQDNRIPKIVAAKEVDDGVKPIDYLYSPEQVLKVRYVMNSRCFNDLWKSEVEYYDMSNGDEAAEKSKSELDYFIWKSDERISLMKNKGSYVVPYYSDGIGGVNVQPFRQAFQILKLSEQDGELYFVDRQHWEGMIKLARKGFFDDDLIYICKAGTDDENRLWDYMETRPLATYRKIQYEKDKHTITLTYRRINSVKSMVAELHWAGLKLYYEEGVLKEVKKEKWKKLGALSPSEQDYIEQTTDGCLSKGILDDTMLTDMAKVLDEVKKGNIDNVSVEICYPQEIRELQLPTEEVKKNGLGRDCWKGTRIWTWLEAYQETFSFFYINYKENKVSGLKEYCVPELSISHPKIPRTRFKFNGLLDAPIMETEPEGEFELQVYYKGECDELRFEVDHPSSITVTPSVIKSPKDKNTIKVTYTGNYVPVVKVDVIGVVTHWYKADDVMLAGRLKVRINDMKEILHITAVKVSVDGVPISANYVEGIKDQYAALSNALSQIGLQTHLLEISVDLPSSTLNKYMTQDELDNDICFYNDTYKKNFGIGDEIIAAIVKKFGKQSLYVLATSVSFFYIDKKIKDSTMAFQCESMVFNCSYELFGEQIGYRRGDISTIAHETGHALSSLHSFQMKGDNRSNPFCFSVHKTSNIMDYVKQAYSLHKYQWDIMRGGMLSFQYNTLKNPILKKQLLIDKMGQKKRDRLAGRK